MFSAKIDANPETTQEALLLHLKKAGEMTVAQLSALLGVTEMAVRRHLSHLQSKGLGRITTRQAGARQAQLSLSPGGTSRFALSYWFPQFG